MERVRKTICRLLCGLAIFVFIPLAFSAGSGIFVKNGEITEGDYNTSTMQFIVSHTLAAPFPVVVYFNTVDGSAKSGKDYISTSGSVTIPAHEKYAIINVPIVNDQIFTQKIKRFTLSVASMTTVITAVVSGTIYDNDDLKSANNSDMKR